MTVHMGYSMTQKGYILYDLETRRLGVSRDVVFKEDVFPFRNKISEAGNKLFVPYANVYNVSDMDKIIMTREGTTPTTPEVHNTQKEDNRRVEVSMTPDRGTRRFSRDRNPPI